ncbi:MAG: hypothetical protein PHP37_01395 [Patescibacteria group bacterium]|nr:hypothetical protein [Patescibacteria group bacterium]
MGELKILGKMDLSQFEKRGPKIKYEKIGFFLKDELKKVSDSLNKEYESSGPILERDLTIKMDGPDADFHKKVVENKEMVWASEKSCSISQLKEKKDKDPSVIAEILVSLLLHGCLKDRFLVARASYYDDYENGVDYVLVDKKTGAVVCGFDQVLGIGSDDGSIKKRDKIKKINLKGGAYLEYGITFSQDGELVKKKIKNIPAFFLAISKNDLDKIIETFQDKIDQKDFSLDDLSEDKEFVNFSEKILSNMLASLEEQFIICENLMESDVNCLHFDKLLDNIGKFRESLEFIKEKIKC